MSWQLQFDFYPFLSQRLIVFFETSPLPLPAQFPPLLALQIHILDDEFEAILSRGIPTLSPVVEAFENVVVHIAPLLLLLVYKPLKTEKKETLKTEKKEIRSRLFRIVIQMHKKRNRSDNDPNRTEKTANRISFPHIPDTNTGTFPTSENKSD